MKYTIYRTDSDGTYPTGTSHTDDCDGADAAAQRSADRFNDDAQRDGRDDYYFVQTDAAAVADTVRASLDRRITR